MNVFRTTALSVLIASGIGCTTVTIAETADETVNETATDTSHEVSDQQATSAAPSADPRPPASSFPVPPVSTAASTQPVTPAPVQGSGTNISDAHRLILMLADLNTFTADVRQLIVESTGGVLEESRIHFMLRRPHGLYWETLEPFAELIVTDGESLWNYQPDLLQLTIEDWDAERTELAARLLSGRTEALADEYAISASAIEDRGWEFALRPYNPASLYERVILYFEADELESILLVSTNGQRTFWEFFDRQINIALDASHFRFTPPDDDMLEILDNRRTQ